MSRSFISQDQTVQYGVAVGASKTKKIVSEEFPISLAGSTNIRVKLRTSAITVAAGITALLETGTGDTQTGTFVFVDADVNTGTDAVTETAHGLASGDTCILSSSGTLPAGLTTFKEYFIIRTDADTIKFATTRDNAMAGTAVDITAAAGGGNHTVTWSARRFLVTAKTVTLNANGDFYLTLNIEVSGDQADLPLMPVGRVVVTTGAGDAVTISEVKVIQGI